jgi:hypothetical protein
LAVWGAPPNDSFANAVLLTGDFGTVTGSTVGATSELPAGEPPHAGLGPKNSIWYKWTATADGPIEFDTFNSQCDTVLAVYVGDNLRTLSQVVANDDINTYNPENPNGSQPQYSHTIGYTDAFTKNPYLGPSGVKFNAKHGTTYYIAVDGTSKGGTAPPAQGQVILSWAYNSSGVFRFSRYYYLAADSESDKPVHSSESSSARGTVVTVTRLFGSSGKVIVTWDLTNGTAVLGTDYSAPTNRQLVFEDGETSKSFIIPIIDDGGNGSVAIANPGRIGLINTFPISYFNVLLTNAVLDPLGLTLRRQLSASQTVS